MEISKMNAEKGFEVMARLAPLVAKLLSASDLKAAKESLPDTFSGVNIMEIVYPALAGGHADTIIKIAAILAEKPEDEMRKASMGEVCEVLRGLTLKEFFDFFAFARGLASHV